VRYISLTHPTRSAIALSDLTESIDTVGVQRAC